jgi:hypothetical protein
MYNRHTFPFRSPFTRRLSKPGQFELPKDLKKNWVMTNLTNTSKALPPLQEP